MRVSEQAVFQQFFDSFAATHRLHPRQWRAAQSIRDCGTRAMGAHVLACPSGAYEQLQFHACRHRCCPRCADSARQRWIDNEMQRLLPCPHFHVIFTLPHELLPLWEFNRAAFMTALMRCVRESLLQLMGSSKHLGATPGLLLSLHTWGRSLSHHPHVHCLVTAGGIDSDGLWRSCRGDWLLPVKQLQALYSGKILAAVSHGITHQWQLPPAQDAARCLALVRELRRKHWNIEIRPPYEHGRGVVLYLARYAKGGPLARSHVLDLRDRTIHFDYTDHREQRRKSLALSTDEFIARVLWHAPPRGLHTTRHAGLYSTAARAQHSQAALQIAASPTPHGAPTWPRPRPATAAAAPTPICPHCGLALLRARRVLGLRLTRHIVHHRGEISPPSTPNPAISLNSTTEPRQRGPTPSFKPTFNG